MLALAASLASVPLRALAQEAPAGVGPREIWVGADAGMHNWLAYTGATYAPWGDIHQGGFRVRSTAGYGHYDFDVARSGPALKTHVAATKSYADLMMGYQARLGDLTAKAFAGYAALQTEQNAPGYRSAELRTGFKGALELWLNIGTEAWASADVSYADTRQAASARVRAGYRLVPTLSVGAEAVLNHANMFDTVYNRTVNDGRAGLFARYEWFGGEISASGGVATEVQQSDPLRGTSAYGTVNWIVQF